MDPQNRAELTAGLQQFGVMPTEGMILALGRHLEMVVDWNERINLTAITDEREMVIKHVVDSASALTVIPGREGMKVLDVGTGAGFPGVVLKCLHPDWQITLLESLNKRCTFLKAVGEEVITQLSPGASGYEVLWGRAEDLGRDKIYREQFDVVIARAVAELRILCEYCLPFCKVGGGFLAMKGPAVDGEISAAAKALRTLGGEVEATKEIVLPHDAGTRSLVWIRKLRETPSTYPRKAGTPSKTPL